MANDYGVADLLEFLAHASQRGLMPAATAQALAVACRNVFGILGDDETADLRSLDLDAVVKRFTNKRAKEFNPTSLKEYSRRARRAVELYLQWRENPADFSVKTRTTNASRKERPKSAAQDNGSRDPELEKPATVAATVQQGSYQSAFPVRPGHIVTISNVPQDLTTAEAERLTQFIKMLATQ